MTTDAAPATAATPLAQRAQELLQQLAGPGARLRPDQLTAIEAIAGDRSRALVVQRTGFGKSAIYFIATRLLREAGAGPTLVVSPLLALMRDQVAAAERMGVRSATINSTNVDDWLAIEHDIAAGDVDLVCISPERLNNPSFVQRVLPRLAAGLGLLVIDEAHCISDWGHDFRPDYRRIRDTIANLSPGTPVLATTATANARVCADVAEQLGTGVTVLRGTLERESLALGVSTQPSLAHRLAWLAQRVPQMPGTGIVYCLTVAQTAQVAAFLASQGIDAVAYSSDTDPDERTRLEAAFKANEVKALVATSALGMGVDKPDVAFVFHLGAPPSPIAYYQQVGRAGRSLDHAEAWLLPGSEDRAIWDWFASVGMPSEVLTLRVLDELEQHRGGEPRTVVELERAVDLRRGRLETLLKILDVDGAVRREAKGWVRTDQPWRYDTERVQRIAAARASEAEAMVAYAVADRCLMERLRASLDDPGAEPCGRCQVCTGAPDPVQPDPCGRARRGRVPPPRRRGGRAPQAVGPRPRRAPRQHQGRGPRRHRPGALAGRRLGLVARGRAGPRHRRARRRAGRRHRGHAQALGLGGPAPVGHVGALHPARGPARRHRRTVGRARQAARAPAPAAGVRGAAPVGHRQLGAPPAQRVGRLHRRPGRAAPARPAGGPGAGARRRARLGLDHDRGGRRPAGRGSGRGAPLRAGPALSVLVGT